MKSRVEIREDRYVQWFPPGHPRHDKQATPVYRPGVRKGNRPCIMLCGEHTGKPEYVLEGTNRPLIAGEWICFENNFVRLLPEDHFPELPEEDMDADTD